MPPHHPDPLYGLHDPGGNCAAYAAEGFGVMMRLNNGYPQWNAMGPGTIPPASQYESFARRCGAFAGASQGAHIWIIGNEMNMAAERPGVYIDTSRGAPPLPSPARPRRKMASPGGRCTQSWRQG